MAVAASGTRAPSASLVAALDATTRAGGPLNEARKDALAAAFAAVVGGSGVAPSLAEQTGQDVRALLGGGLLPADLSALAPRRRPAEGPRRPDPDGADDPRLVVPGGRAIGFWGQRADSGFAPCPLSFVFRFFPVILVY